MNTPIVSSTDYQLRFKSIREFLTSEGLGALFVYSPPMEHKWGQTGHVSYLSGWANHDRIVDSVVVVPVNGHPVLLVAGMPFMQEQIAEVSPINDVRLVQAIDPNAVAVDSKAGSGPNGFAQEAIAILQENGFGNMPIGVVGIESMGHPFYQTIFSTPGEQFRCVKDVVGELRCTKNPDEIELMRHAARLSDIGFATMLKTARSGMRGIEIIAEMERSVRREGADHAKYWMASGPPPDWENVQIDLKPHMRILQEGDLMASCSYVCYKGYWCHGQRTGTLERRCPELEEICRITREAQDAGLAEIKPGVPVGHVTRTINSKAAEHGWEIQGGRFGHGIGLDYSELPSVTESNETPLEIGTTVVLHAVFSLPDSGKMFVPLGDVCAVTANGPELLMSFPRTPFVAGK